MSRVEIQFEKEERVPKKKPTRGRGRPITDPFRDQVLKQGVANTYTKNIPAKDWDAFAKFVRSRGWTHRYALIRFIQELPSQPKWMEVL